MGGAAEAEKAVFRRIGAEPQIGDVRRSRAAVVSRCADITRQIEAVMALLCRRARRSGDCRGRVPGSGRGIPGPLRNWPGRCRARWRRRCGPAARPAFPSPPWWLPAPPPSAPFQPAWAAPITLAWASANSTGAQSAVRMPSARPGVAVTMASPSAARFASQSGAQPTWTMALWIWDRVTSCGVRRQRGGDPARGSRPPPRASSCEPGPQLRDWHRCRSRRRHRGRRSHARCRAGLRAWLRGASAASWSKTRRMPRSRRRHERQRLEQLAHLVVADQPLGGGQQRLALRPGLAFINCSARRRCRDRPGIRLASRGPNTAAPPRRPACARAAKSTWAERSSSPGSASTSAKRWPPTACRVSPKPPASP